MNNPMKKTWAMLSAAALVTVAVIGCGGSKSVNQPPTPQPQATTQPVSSPSAPTAKTAAADDELDMAIRDASDYLNDNIPAGSKIVILNIESNSSNLSEYIIDELIANVINDKTFSVVDRRQLEAIQAEQKFQMSGAVDDKDALAIGKFFGAQTIISGAMRDIGGRYRLTIRALAVQTAQVQGQYNRNMPISETLAGLANSGGSRTVSSTAAYGTTATTGSSTTQTVTATPTAQAAAPTSGQTAPVEPPITGTMVPGNGLEDKLTWLIRSADSHNTYILEVNADETIAPNNRLAFSGGINITVVLRGIGGNRTIRLRSNGSMFTIGNNVTFILDNNITLQGHKGNREYLINIPHSSSGTFRMRTGSIITGNDYGGVYNGYGGTFEMNGGTISNNNTPNSGGGVYNDNNGTFIMTGGSISGNTANSTGGGVCMWGGTFTMRGGTISGNTAHESGGGMWMSVNVTFAKTGGIITGYSSDQANGNVVKDADGYILGRKGHAVFLQEGRARKETTAGSNVNLSSGGSKGTTGAWDN